MKHKIGFNALGRRSAHRKALHRNMVISLFRYERIRTTKAKAKEIRKTAEKLVTRAKEDSVHNRRIAAKRIHDKAVLAKLFTELGPRYQSRPGGYTRILKLGYREGDGSEIVILELVDRKIKERAKPKKEKKTEEKKPAEEK
ncbi:MAG: 50S ribosomal protein L17 [Spirochaetales bacterium]|jgi:large subunit ribosomal protein L17|nr:50S ribosomal protein L17 [Spirochaetales bacterium]